LNTYSLYPLPSHLVVCDITVALSFSFSILSVPKYHRVVILLQIYSTAELTYDHVCFCVYVYLWICLPHMRGSMHLLCFWSWLTWCPPIASKRHVIIPCGWVIFQLELASNTRSFCLSLQSVELQVFKAVVCIFFTEIFL
jgi:hypothetical protein